MLVNGVDLLTVTRRLGHTKASTTLDNYAHTVPGLQDKVAILMDELTTPIALPPERVAHELPTYVVLEHESED